MISSDTIKIIDMINDRISNCAERMKEIRQETGTSCAAFSMEMGAHDELISLKEEIESAE